MSLFTIDPEKCRRDGACVAECPRRIIEMKDPSAVPTPVEGAEGQCILCGHCVAVCSQGALSHAQMKSAECPPVRRDMEIPFAQAEYFLRSRRSIRSFKNQAVERDKLVQLIDVARLAPTGRNSQLVHWLGVDSREKVFHLAGIVMEFFQYLIAQENPFAEKFGLKNVIGAWEAGVDVISRGAPAMVFTHAPKDYGLAATDETIALTFLDLLAPTIGLGTCWGGYFMIAAAQWPPLLQALGLPEGHACCGAMMIGYPKFKYHRLPLRNEPRLSWLSFRDDREGKS